MVVVFLQSLHDFAILLAMMKLGIWWIRRDLRLCDNNALHTALCNNDAVVPLFIIDPIFFDSPDFCQKQADFMFDGLRELDEALRARGSFLVVRRGEPVAVLRQLFHEVGATHIYAEEAFSAYARRRDAMVSAELPLTLVGGVTAKDVRKIKSKSGDPYTVFTPYKKSWLASDLPNRSDLLPIPELIVTPNAISAESLPIRTMPPIFTAGEREALRRLDAFCEKSLDSYSNLRDRVDIDGTSMLSPYLRFGMVSPRTAIVTALQQAEITPPEQRKGVDHWVSELIWREFYQMILYHFPQVEQGSFRPEYDQIAWRNDSAEFEAWCQGQTGYPIVDAAMRQLNATGWMHNRARMIVASFLTKDLLIDWRWGERAFMRQLIDGDIASNNGGWQWTAGTGTDAAPYFRIFNPTLQSIKFDPDGRYIRQWVPELASVPNDFIHAPSEMSDLMQLKTGVKIGRIYPAPLVDHNSARQITLAAYQAVRTTPYST